MMTLNSIKTFIRVHKIGILTTLALIVYFILWLVYGNKLEAKVPVKYHGLSQLSLLIVPFIILMLGAFYAQRSDLMQDFGVPRSGKLKVPGVFNFLGKSTGLIAILAGICGLIFAIFWVVKEYRTADVVVTSILDVLFALVGIAILYKVGSKLSTLTLPAPLRLIKEVILYFPCLLLSLINWIRYEYKITAKPVWILLAIEIGIIGLRFLLPWLIETVLNHEGQLLLRNPVYLNNETAIGTFDKLHKERLSKSDIQEKGAFNYNYAISGWFFINPQPPSGSVSYSEDTSILNYGGKPNVTYNGKTDTLKVTISQDQSATTNDGAREVVILKHKRLPLQKWNNIVLNMNGGMLDVFLNGKLIVSGPDTMAYMSYDNLTVGAPKGVQGAACNVRYFDKPLSLTQISLQYNTYRGLTPPVV